MSMVVKGEFALFGQAKHAISVTTLISQSACSATCNTHASNVTKCPSMDEAAKARDRRQENKVNELHKLTLLYQDPVS